MKSKLITLFISIFIIVSAVCYVNYLINKPLDMEIPKHFIYNNTNIALDWTDDNTGENLIIQSDKKEYSGFSGVDVYFSITNTSRKDQNTDIAIWLPDSKTKVEKVERINKDGSNFQFSIFNFEINSNSKIKNRKDVGKNSVNNAINDKIKSGETNYYKATIKYPSMSKGEFFIEAFGDNGAYGHLDPWYSSDWNYKRQITINASQIATTTSAFPVLATTTLADLKTSTNGGKVESDNGYDIIFVDDDDATLLNFEREKYASTTGEIVYWIKTDISSTTDKTIYMYYGNVSAVDQATTTGVWDDNYVMVQHLQETPVGTTYDSTSNSNDGTTNNMDSADQVAGQIDGSLDFDGSDDYVGSGASLGGETQATVSVWVNQALSGGSIYGSWVSSNTAYNAGFFLGRDGSDGNIQAYIGGNKHQVITLTYDEMNHIVFIYNNSATEIFRNGVSLGVDDVNVPASIPSHTGVEIGTNIDSNLYANAIIDEVRISNVARSAGWIETEYNNQSDAGSFMTMGEEEDKIPTITSTEDSPNPVQRNSTVTFSVDWNDSDSSNIKVKICKTDSLTNQNCDGGYYASSTALTTNDPETVTYNIQDDDSGTKNYYAFVCDDDGNCSASAHGSFAIRTTQINSSSANNENWYNANWKYKRAITLDSSQIATTTSNFPVLATTTLADLKSYGHDGNVGNSSGYDIIFVDSDNKTLLNFEREKYASTTGEIVYWIKTDISSITDKTIYMYYGNASAVDQATTTGVWDDNFVMVQHLQEDPGPGGTGDIKDSTKYNNNGTATTSMTTSDQVAGQIDGSLDFDWVDDFVTINSGIVTDYPFTMAGWFRSDNITETTTIVSISDVGDADYHRLFVYGNAAGDPIGVQSQTTGSNFAQSTTGITQGSWHYAVGVFLSETSRTVYLDGGSSATGTDSVPFGTISRTDIGSNYGNATAYERFNGIIDEVRVSNVARSAGWIETEYNNQSAVGSFMTIGTEDSLNRTAIVNSPIKNYLTDGLVGHWTFNGGDMDWSSSTAEALDRSGNNNNGNVMNGAKAVIGKVGQGLEFDGDDDKVHIETISFADDIPWTMSMWFQRDISTGTFMLFANNDLSLSRLQSASSYLYFYNADVSEYVVWEKTFQADVWYHMTIFCDGSDSDNIFLYLDGVAQTTKTLATSTNMIKAIGGLYNSTSYSFDGSIDEVRVYNRALSEDEIGQLYRIGTRSMRF